MTARSATSLITAVLAAACLVLTTGCQAGTSRSAAPSPSGVVSSAGSSSPAATGAPSAAGGSPVPTPPAPPFRHPLPGMPPALHNDVYAATRAGLVRRRLTHEP